MSTDFTRFNEIALSHRKDAFFDNREDEGLSSFRRTLPLPSSRLLKAKEEISATETSVGSLEELSIRIFDILGAAVILVLALPFLLSVMLAMQIDSPGKVLFVQKRVGRGGKLFPCLKLRTMVTDADRVLAEYLATNPIAQAEWDQDFKLKDDPRITKLGRIMRKFSIDEFPQLLNILAGHMSLVGPRPIVPKETERYGRYYGSYIAVRPGLTGLWQISGRNNVTYRRRILLDDHYVRQKSLRTDVRILMMTVPAVLMAKGSY